MKHLVHRLLALLIVTTLGSQMSSVLGQAGILNPADPIVIYNAQSPPTQPTYGQIGKWVKTNRLNWNTSDYKCYIYKGMVFRLKFPTSYQHGVADGKTYPVFVFFHGVGEKGTIYDNEFQLYHGGEVHKNAVNSGKFDGFLLYPQNTGGYFNTNNYDFIKEIIENVMVPQVKVDINRIYLDGLSGGGGSSWDFLFRYPKLIAACLPISAASLSSIDKLDPVKYTPLWQFQGGLDRAPAPGTSHQLRDAGLAMGAQYSYTEYPDQGHGCWYSAWAEPDFYPFLNRAHKANPWPLSGRSEFCPGDPVNVKIGVTAGFDGYEWRKDNVLITGATTNELQVTALGTYDVRIKRGTVWSPWSPRPLVIKTKTATIAPPITIAGLMSKVIPATDGNTGVTLTVPQGYASYLWQKSGDTATISTTNTLNAVTAGNYIVKVTEQFGCSSSFSAPFTVVDANGPNKPDAAISLSVSTVSKTSLRLDWSDNPAPVNNETNFEIYRASQAGGPYKLIFITSANVITYTSTDLTANTKYFYKVRAVNNTAAAAPSNEASGTTAADVQAPTAPTDLMVTSATRNSISLAWNASTDDVAVTNYDVYINGQKAFVTPDLSFTVYNLEYSKSYNFAIKARDFANNASPFSNQVTGQALRNGLNYKYYTFTGTWNNLPDFSLLTPEQTGVVPNVIITDRSQNDNFAFLWEGDITIPVAGNYTFRTNSDDGSKLYLGALNGTSSPYSFAGTALVNNDGLHGGQNKDGSITLAAGRYPIAITFYEQGGGESMTVTWKTPQSGTSFIAIPNSAFVDPVIVNGVAPVAPSGLNATAISHKKVGLSWTDNSNNETGFEIWRSTNIVNGFVTIGNTAANAVSFTDSLVSPSTTYYYQLKALGQFGESGFTRKFTEANWKLNNNYTDASGNSRTLTTSGSPTFDAASKMEGTHAVKLNGTSQYMNIPVSSSFLQNSYSEKTVSLWIRSSSNTGNRVILDLGGSDNGLALVLNNNTLIAGIASANTRKTIVTPYTSTGWNHVALVYNKSSLKLYVNGTEVIANNALGFSTLNTTTNASRIGSNSGSNAYNTNGALFSGWMDEVYIFNAALTAADITALKNFSAPVLSNATTLQAPVAPQAPATLLASGISSSANQVSWLDNSTTEDKFELYRSSNSNANYVLLSALPANTVSYKDSSLFANSVYYYKVRAINEGGASAYSNEDSAKTGNNLPVITAIGNQYMRFGTQVQVNVSATDADGEALSMLVSGLPSFASFTPAGNGAGLINFNSAQDSDQGVYNVTITVTDQNGGSDVKSFTMTVNNNYSPVIASIANVTVTEKQVAQLNLSATDQNAGDALVWSFTGLPSFAAVSTGTGTAQLNITPGYSDAGTYQVTAKADDGNNGTSTATFVITVIDANPNKKIYINFGDASLIAPAPWNNTAKVPAQNDSFPNLKDDSGVGSGIGLRIMSAWQLLGNGTNTLGVNTGNNSGVYPDNVLRSAYYSNTTQQTLRISGLDLNTKYNFTFFGSRGGVGDNRTTVYTIKGTSVSLNAAGNSTNTVRVDAIQPDADGTLTLTIKNGVGSQFSYLNAMVIESNYDDGSVPAVPKNVAGQVIGSKVNLSWQDAAYNENSYEVYRASAQEGPYTLLTPVTGKNAVQYVDSSVQNNSTYYYKVRAVNTYGNSAFTDALAVAIPNTAPALANIANINLKNDDVSTVNVTATDAGDVITFKAKNLPAFASFTDNGNGTAVISLNPGLTDIGTYPGVVISATDNKGAVSADTITIAVSNKDIVSIYVNFNQVLPVGAPWNSFNNTAVAGRSISNMLDEKGSATGATISLLDAFTGANDLGTTTGNNSGIYPDDVLRTAYYESTTTPKRIRITGLTNLKKYNLVFFGSRVASDNRTTDYSSGGKTVSLNTAGNTSNTVQINGLVPDANGILEFTVARGAGSSNGYINALVIQSYVDNGKPLTPDALQASPKSKSTIQLNWNDKSDNETGFQVYRSSTQNGTYTLVNTTGPNVTTYMDQALQSNTQYYYKVRAVSNAITSDYSNIASASTFAFQVYVNFNRDNPAAAPWNNTNNVPQLGSVYDNLNNEQGNPTGIDMTVTKDFSGENPFGMNTGNNSGIFPDNVIRSTWWLDANVTSQLKISGLSQTMNYSFVFFGSRDGSGDRTTVYTVNGKSVSLNCSFNTSQTVQIDNIRADENGEVLINISLGATSSFGYIGALVIQASTAPAGSTPATLMYAGNNANRISNTAPLADEASSVLLKGWPNPFGDFINVSANFAKPQSDVIVRIVDLNGSVVNVWKFSNVPGGNWNQRLNMVGKARQAGMYFLQVVGSGSKNTTTIKLLKVK